MAGYSVQDELNQIRNAVDGAVDTIRKAREVIARKDQEIQRLMQLCESTQQIAREAIDGLTECGKQRQALRETVLEIAVNLEKQQLYYSHKESYDHDNLRIANERLNGIYSVMPKIFGKTQRECIDLVRGTAAEASK